MKPVLITTQHRGVFAGLVPDEQDMSARSMPLKEARMAIRWRGGKGVMDLALGGPTDECQISSKADAPMINDITAIFDVTDEAWSKWQSKSA